MSGPSRRESDLIGTSKSWVASTPISQLVLSVVVIGEIRKGIETLRKRGEARHTTILSWLGQLEQRCHGRVLGIDAEIAHEWGRMTADSPDHPNDTWLAAQARVRGLIVVTRNVAHFKNRGVTLLNPFDPAP